MIGQLSFSSYFARNVVPQSESRKARTKYTLISKKENKGASKTLLGPKIYNKDESQADNCALGSGNQ